MSNIDKLHSIKESIEVMNKNYHIEILKMLIDDKSVNISENNNGSFVNLTTLDDKIINKLEQFIGYVNKQQNQLSFIENEKVNIKNEFFNNNKKNNKIKPVKKDSINSVLDAK